MNMEIKTDSTLSISRISSNEGDYVRIKVTDIDSNSSFLLDLSLADFAHAVTGCVVTVPMTIPGDPANFGKVYETKHFSVGVDSNDKDKAIVALEKACPEGWHVSTYLGSQRSFTYLDGKCKAANTYLYRWVKKEEVS